MTLQLTREDLKHELELALRPYCVPECAEARAPECLEVLEQGGKKSAVFTELWEVLARIDRDGNVHPYCRDAAVRRVYTMYQHLSQYVEHKEAI